MRRRVVHGAFGTAAFLCAGLVTYQGLHLYQSNRLNAAIVSERLTDHDAAVLELRFARALALARAGESDAAVTACKAVIREGRRDLRHRALYNLGNLYMRDALENGADEAFTSLPLVELAKLSYRELLRAEPDHWDARHNLERALRLAPEFEHEIEEEEQPPEKEQSVSTLQGVRIDLP